MKPIKLLAYSTILLMLTGTADAKKRGNGANRKAQQQEEKEKQEKKEARDNKNNAIDGFLTKKDGNHDGSVTLEEYLKDEADPAAATNTFNEFNKNKDRYLTKGEIAKLLGL